MAVYFSLLFSWGTFYLFLITAVPCLLQLSVCCLPCLPDPLMAETVSYHLCPYPVSNTGQKVLVNRLKINESWRISRNLLGPGGERRAFKTEAWTCEKCVWRHLKVYSMLGKRWVGLEDWHGGNIHGRVGKWWLRNEAWHSDGSPGSEWLSRTYSILETVKQYLPQLSWTPTPASRLASLFIPLWVSLILYNHVCFLLRVCKANFYIFFLFLFYFYWI